MPASHYKRKVKKNVDRNNRGRFRTQPVTFMEIKVRVQTGWDLYLSNPKELGLAVKLRSQSI